jgi:hypothetical protein
MSCRPAGTLPAARGLLATLTPSCIPLVPPPPSPATHMRPHLQVSVHLARASNALNPALSESVALAKKLAKSAAHAKRVRQRLAREAARADRAEQAATLGGMYQGQSARAVGPPVLSRGMSVIFVALTVGAIFGVIWYVRKPEAPPEYGTRTDEVFAQSSQQYV